MANEIHVVQKTPIVIADATDYSGDIGTRTDQIDLTSLGAGAARQSDKVDLRVVGNLAQWYEAFLAIEFGTAPSAGGSVDLYAAFSPSGTAGTANPGACSGADASYNGTGTLADALKQLTPLGSLSATNDGAGTVQFRSLGRFAALEFWACLVVVNNGSSGFHTDANEMGIRIVPYVPEVQ